MAKIGAPGDITGDRNTHVWKEHLYNLNTMFTWSLNFLSIWRTANATAAGKALIPNSLFRSRALDFVSSTPQLQTTVQHSSSSDLSPPLRLTPSSLCNTPNRRSLPTPSRLRPRSSVLTSSDGLTSLRRLSGDRTGLGHSAALRNSPHPRPSASQPSAPPLHCIKSKAKVIFYFLHIKIKRDFIHYMLLLLRLSVFLFTYFIQHPIVLTVLCC
nr:hypothetical protein Iba_chr09cCG9220 [Ipomoea batatas]